MNVSIRSTAMAALAVALSFALLACKPLDKDTGKPADGSGDAAATTKNTSDHRPRASFLSWLWVVMIHSG